MENELSYIANNMKSLRIRRGLTQEETAELLGITRQAYSSYEVNPAKVSIKTYYILSGIFNCKLGDFFINHNVADSNK